MTAAALSLNFNNLLHCTVIKLSRCPLTIGRLETNIAPVKGLK